MKEINTRGEEKENCANKKHVTKHPCKARVTADKKKKKETQNKTTENENERTKTEKVI